MTIGEYVTEEFSYDGGRKVTVYVPRGESDSIVFAGDGMSISTWGSDLAAAGSPGTMVVGVHHATDETRRLREYSPGLDPASFRAHERFFAEEVPRWVRTRFGVSLPGERTAVFGVSAGGELALAIGLRHPAHYGAVFSASPGGGYRPPSDMPAELPRIYLVAGTREPFFLDNAFRWAAALEGAGAVVRFSRRDGSHGGAFWRTEFPLMVSWAFRRHPSAPGPSV